MSPGVDDYVRATIIGTHGNLYRHARLTRYPIPHFPLTPGHGKRLLDIGCNWGRWTISAAGAGYCATGVDTSRGAIGAARRVAGQLGAKVTSVVGDARQLPFTEHSFDVVFSYSVLQHLAKDDVRRAVTEIARVLRPGGFAWVEVPNAWGALNLARQAARGFAPASGRDVRYWTPRELRETFAAIGPVELLADGFLTINPQLSDLDLLPRSSRFVVRLSDALRRASMRVPFLVYAADSVIVRAQAR